MSNYASGKLGFPLIGPLGPLLTGNKTKLFKFEISAVSVLQIFKFSRLRQ